MSPMCTTPSMQTHRQAEGWAGAATRLHQFKRMQNQRGQALVSQQAAKFTCRPLTAQRPLARVVAHRPPVIATPRAGGRACGAYRRKWDSCFKEPHRAVPCRGIGAASMRLSPMQATPSLSHAGRQCQNLPCYLFCCAWSGQGKPTAVPTCTSCLPPFQPGCRGLVRQPSNSCPLAPGHTTPGCPHLWAWQPRRACPRRGPRAPPPRPAPPCQLQAGCAPPQGLPCCLQ